MDRNLPLQQAVADDYQSPNSVMAQWEVSREDWKKFYTHEVAERKMTAIVLGVLIGAISSLIFIVVNNQTWLLVIGAIVFLALLWCFLSYQIAVSSIGRPGAAVTRITITGNSVLVNDKLRTFSDEKRRLNAVNIYEDPDPKVLELVCVWKASEGIGRKAIRIPIPKGKLGEAVRLMEKLSNNSTP